MEEPGRGQTVPGGGAEPEETLDPLDWDAFRAFGHRVLDDAINHLATRRDRPTWHPMPEAVKENFNQPLPLEGEGVEAVYREFVENILPFPNGNTHPRFWGWVQGTGTPLGMLADMLASAMNAFGGGMNQSPARVEEQVIAWMAELMGLPKGTSGLLTSGCTMASINALVVARHCKAGFDVRREGLQGAGRAKLLLYGSAETHSWAVKAAELLGLGSAGFRRVPVDAEFRMDTAALLRMVAEDRDAGHRPFCVIGTAGTVNTGATDDLRALAHICREQDLWFHVDGAFGALARLVADLRPLVAGIEEADSVALDLHKWMYLPFEIGCVLIRDADAHRRAFALTAGYTAEFPRGVIAGGLPFADRGLELTRGFKALKAWMSLKAHGVNQFSRLIEQNVRQARYLVELIEHHPGLQLLAPAPLNVVCFRFRAEGLDEEGLNRVNREVLMRVQESGVAVPSSTTIGGAFALRVAVVNHRSRLEDFQLFAEAVVECGNQVVREWKEHTAT